MKKLIIHIGHGKTGSSYLQSVFALNKDMLKKEGFDYPDHKDSKVAEIGYISAGNGDLLLENDFFDTEYECLFFSHSI